MMMVAGGGFGIGQSPRQQFLHPLIRVAGTAGVQPDARLRQSHLGASADAAADQAVHTLGG